MPTTLYSKDDVQRHLNVAEALAVVEKTYVETAQDRVVNPSKLTMHLGDDGGWPDLNAFSIDMPAYVDWLAVAGVKWAVATWDAATDVPISARILLFDPERGAFTSVMEGMYLTGVRTALQSVVGLRHLLPATPSTVGVFGAGFQARFQLSVIDRLVDVDAFRLFDVDADRARALAGEVGPRLDARTVVDESPEATAASDAVVTVTDSKTPVLEDDWLAPNTSVVALGSYRELPDGTVLDADHVVVDHPEQCLERGALADLVDRGRLARDDLDATVGEVLDGEYGERITPDDRVVFVPIGLGSLDVAIAEHLRRGTEHGAVRSFSFR